MTASDSLGNLCLPFSFLVDVVFLPPPPSPLFAIAVLPCGTHVVEYDQRAGKLDRRRLDANAHDRLDSEFHHNVLGRQP